VERAPIKCPCGCERDLWPELERLLASIESAERRTSTAEVNARSAEVVSTFDAEDCINALALANAAGIAQHPTKYHMLLTALMIPPAHALIAARIRQLLGQPAAAAGGAR